MRLLDMVEESLTVFTCLITDNTFEGPKTVCQLHVVEEGLVPLAFLSTDKTFMCRGVVSIHHVVFQF